MKPTRAWAILSKSTGRIFMDTIDGGRNWNLDIFTLRDKYGLSLMDEFEVVRVEIRAVKPKKRKQP